MKNANLGDWIRQNANVIAMYVFLIIVALPFVFPFWWMITSSFKSTNDIFSFPPTLLPDTWKLENYISVFDLQPFMRQFWNSVYTASATTFITLFCASLAGYAFSRLEFRGRNLIFLLIVSAILMPSEVTIIPVFTYMQELDLVNSHIPIILLPVFGSQGVVAAYIMRQYCLGIPTELEEAALLDGLSRWGIYRRIVLPLARPALIAIAILSFLNSWNLFLEPLVLINDPQMFTLPLALRGYVDPYGQPLWGEQLAATTMSVVPVLIIYIFAQRHVVESFAFSGVK